MKYQIKMTLTYDVLIVGFLFSIFLVLIRSVSSYDEVGPVIDSFLAFLSIILFSNIYYGEVKQKTAETFSLVPLKQKISELNKRLIIKFVFFLLLFIVTYGLFKFHKPYVPVDSSALVLFIQAFFAVSASVMFWGILSYTLVNVFRNLLIGVSVGIVFWFIMNSTVGKSLPIFLNIFAYGEVVNGVAVSDWYISKLIGVAASILLLLLNVGLLKKNLYKY